MLDGSLNKLTKKYNKKILKINYKGKIQGKLQDGMNIIYNEHDEAKIELDENKIKFQEAISKLSSLVIINDLDIENTPIDNIVANLYKEYKI